MRLSAPQYVLGITVLLLPWQAVWLFSPSDVATSSFTRLAFYGTDVLLLANCLWLISAIRRPRVTVSNSWWLYGAALFSLLLSTSLAPVPMLAVQKFISFFLVGLFVWLAATRMPQLFFLMLGVAVGIGVAGYGIGQFLLQSISQSTLLGIASQSASVLGTAVIETDQGRFLRAYGPFPHPNILGGYVALALLFTVACYFKVYEKFQPWWTAKGRALSAGTLWQQPIIWRTAATASVCLATFVVLTIGLLTSFSRSAMVGAVFGVGAFLYRKIQQNPVRGAVLSGKILLVACLATAAWMLSVPGLFQGRLTMSGRLETHSVENRLTQYGEAGALFATHPLRGVGVGNYVPALMSAFPGLAAYSYQPVHNTFVLAAIEMGSVVILILLFLIYHRRALLQQLLRSPLGAGVVFTLLPPMLFDHYMWSLHSGILLLILAGLAVTAKDAS